MGTPETKFLRTLQESYSAHSTIESKVSQNKMKMVTAIIVVSAMVLLTAAKATSDARIVEEIPQMRGNVLKTTFGWKDYAVALFNACLNACIKDLEDMKTCYDKCKKEVDVTIDHTLPQWY